MCSSATASFGSAGVIGVIGAASWARTRRAREAPVASLPLLFAVHQAVEGVVWVAVRHHEPALRFWAARVPGPRARTPIVIAYVAASNASLFASSWRSLRAFALALGLGLIVSVVTSSYAFVSVWCAFAALASALIYRHVTHPRSIKQGALRR